MSLIKKFILLTSFVPSLTLAESNHKWVPVTGLSAPSMNEAKVRIWDNVLEVLGEAEVNLDTASEQIIPGGGDLIFKVNQLNDPPEVERDVFTYKLTIIDYQNYTHSLSCLLSKNKGSDSISHAWTYNMGMALRSDKTYYPCKFESPVNSIRDTRNFFPLREDVQENDLEWVPVQ